MADMRVTRSGDGRVWITSDAGDEFGFEFTTRSALMTEMIGEPAGGAGPAPAHASAGLDRARPAATAFAHDQGWID